MNVQICAPHPAALFSQETTALLASIAGVPVTSVGPGDDSTRLEHIVELMDSHRQSLGLDSWVIWGMSGGSFLAQLYARMHPTRVEGLILASSGPYFRKTVEDLDCILCPRNPRWSNKLDSEGLLDGDYEDGPTAWQFVDGVGWVFRRAGGSALLVSPDTPSAELKRIMPALWAFDACDWLSQIEQPSLVMCGTADPVVPIRHAEALAARLPHARFVPVQHAGHIPLTDQRAVVEGAIRSFLAELL